MSDVLLELCGVSRVYTNCGVHTTVLQDIDLTIRAGEMVAIMGHSGSGKSTLLNILGCLDRPTAGRYRVASQDTAMLGADGMAALRREYFGFVFQRYDLLAHLSAIENVEMPAIYAGLAPSLRRQRANDLLERLGLSARKMYRPAQLSGGQQQRVSIARALVNGAAVILADEPTGALDRDCHDEVLAILRELNDRGHTIIIVTHDADVAACTDRIVEIYNGRIVADRAVSLARVRAANVPHTLREVRPPAAGMAFDRFRISVSMAWLAMLNHRLRTTLTMLGIVIGIASVIAVTGLGEGATRRVIADIRALGGQTLDIYPGANWGDEQTERRQSLREADLPILQAQPYVDSVSPVTGGTETARQGSAKLNVQVSGVSHSWFRATGANMITGKAFTADDVARRAQFIVIDDKLRQRLFGLKRNPLGEVILIGHVPCLVIGVIKSRQSLLFSDPTLNVWMPYTTRMARFASSDYFNQLIVRLKPGVDGWVVKDIDRLLQQRHGRKDFMVSTNDGFLESVKKTAMTLTLMVSSIAAVALLVGGVGVMNIMLVSLSERTREIGIRMAVGARQSDIRQQFLIEAVLICLVGGLLGICLAWTAGRVFQLFQDSITMYMSPIAVVGACVISAGIGIGFGFVPARNASKLNPVQALARE
jgi:macrolide transport system ATP-binding/permease protein